MNSAFHFFPVAIAAIGWYCMHRFNKSQGVFRTGEVIFWDTIILLLVFLVWLKWF